MRKTLLATILGLAALVAAACTPGTPADSASPGVDPAPPSVETPSEMLETESPS